MHNLVHATFATEDDNLVYVENPAVMETLRDTGILSRHCVPSAAEEGSVLVTLYIEETDFVLASVGSYFEDGDVAFQAFLQHTYLTSASPGGLTLTDPRTLDRLLREMLPDAAGAIPTVARRDVVERYHRRFAGSVPRWQPPEFTPRARKALGHPYDTTARTPVCGLFSVCPHDHEPECYSTYAWIEDDVCHIFAIYDGDLSVELFPFRLTR